jgi:general secretion pathway protein J
MRIGLPLRPRSGFTLLEVVVAIGILALIGTLTFSAVAGALDVRNVLERRDQTVQQARIAIDRIRRDLNLAYLTKNTGAINTYRTIFVGQDNSADDRLWFASLSHLRLYKDARECDQTEITYWTEPDPNAEDARVLLRREAPRIDQEPEKDGVIQPLAYNVRSFDVRYLDSTTNEWQEAWDTTGTDTPNRLPRAALVTLTLLAPDPDDEDRQIEQSFVTTVLLAYAPPLQRRTGEG